MRGALRILILLGINFLIMGGCSSTSSIVENESTTETMSSIVTIKSSRSYEKCIIVRTGTYMEYSFDATDFVDFNIHYHTDGKIKYPVKRKGALFGEGTIDPDEHDYYIDEQEYYCLMWDNLNTGKIRVSFSYALKER